MPEQPWFPFFWKDWLASTRGMSADAKGVYIDFLAHAWSTGGLPLDEGALRRIAAVDRPQWKRIWPQLSSRWTEVDGRLVNPRQEDVRRKQAAASKAGRASVEARLRANGSAQPPAIRSNDFPNDSSNGSPNGTPNGARTESEQTPEPIRVQSTEKEKKRESTGVDPTPLFDAWNRLTTAPLPKAEKLTKGRARHIRSRLTEQPIEFWIAAIQRVERTPFCRGVNDRKWRASLDWLIANEDNVVKLNEGRYDNGDALNGTPLDYDYDTAPIGQLPKVEW